MNFLFLILSSLFILSCSTLKDEDCSNRDWKRLGFQDGSKGYSQEMYQTYLKVCEHQETPQTKGQYLNGHNRGASKYCTYDKGVLVGESGRSLPDVCPPQNYPDFLKGYKKGKKKALK